MKLSKEELCKRCVHKQYCKTDKDICDKCKKKVTEFYPISFTGYDQSCYCKGCYEEFKDQENQGYWQFALSLIKTERIHCIGCKTELTHKNLFDGDEDRISIKCPKCELIFTIHHGYPEDEYGAFLEEQEGKEYCQQIKYWKDNGEKGPRPESPEERRLRKALVSKYGEH